MAVCRGGVNLYTKVVYGYPRNVLRFGGGGYTTGSPVVQKDT
jgi:hypothetical protein